MKLFLSFWCGEQPLWKAFWLIWTALYAFVYVLMYAFDYIYYNSEEGDMLTSYALGSVFLIIYWSLAMWYYVSVWRCANNSHKMWGWGGLAKLVVVFGFFFNLRRMIVAATDYGPMCLFDYGCMI